MANLFRWLILGIVHETPHSFFRREPEHNNPFRRATFKWLCVMFRHDYFPAMLGDKFA
jgi:hypothetical protein